MIKLNTNIVVDKKIEVWFDHKVQVGYVAHVLHSLALVLFIHFPLIENVALANHLEIRNHSSAFQVWNSNHSDFVNFLYNCFVGQGAISTRIRTNSLQKVLEVVHIAYLRRNRYTFAIASPDFAVVK